MKKAFFIIFKAFSAAKNCLRPENASLTIHSRAREETVGGVKDKIVSLFKTNTTQNYSKPTRVKNVYKGSKKSEKSKTKKNQKSKQSEQLKAEELEMLETFYSKKKKITN